MLSGKNKFVSTFLQFTLTKYINFITTKQQAPSELDIYINKKNLKHFVYFLKAQSLLLVKVLNDIIIVDYPKNSARFLIIYSFTSIKNNLRLFVKTSSGSSNSVNSLTTLYNAANWLERECWDFFGVFFYNHPDLRRILTDYGFNGFPLRKDFPLTGYIELRYDDEKGVIVYEPLELAQEFRLFNTLSPWEKIK